MGQVDSFRHIAEVLRSAQRAAIELENAPDQRKRLRTFSPQEAASLLGLTLKELRAVQGLQGRVVRATGRLSFDEVQAVRRLLAEDGRGGRHNVGRRPG
jgi:chromosome partitioning protein